MRLLRRLFGLDEGWERPLDRRVSVRADVLVTAVYLVGATLSMLTAQSLGGFTGHERPLWVLYLWVLAPAVVLILRRLYPLVTLAFAIVHFCVTAIWMPDVATVFALQVFYFFSLFSTVAWATNRLGALCMTGLMSVASVLWVVGDVLLRDGLDQLRALPHLGPLSPVAAALVQVGLSTLTFFLTATLAGSLSWWSARRRAQERAQTAIIAQQSDRLQEQAVGEERLRIARELHDVVGHDIAVVGIQTGAARRVLDRDPAKATNAMLMAEEASRAATRDLRLMLSALRLGEYDPEVGGFRAPQPGLATLPELIASFGKLGLQVDDRIEGPVDQVPAAVGMCAYRVVQESLTNVRRHSDATSAAVRLCVVPTRPGAGTLRLSVTDQGRPRGATAGSQMGLVGMRERVALHHGTFEAAPVEAGGYRVAVTLPWAQEVTE